VNLDAKGEKEGGKDESLKTDIRGSLHLCDKELGSHFGGPRFAWPLAAFHVEWCQRGNVLPLRQVRRVWWRLVGLYPSSWPCIVTAALT